MQIDEEGTLRIFYSIWYKKISFLRLIMWEVRNLKLKKLFILLFSSALDYVMQRTKHLCLHNNLAHLTIVTAGISLRAKNPENHWYIFSIFHNFTKMQMYACKSLCEKFMLNSCSSRQGWIYGTLKVSWNLFHEWKKGFSLW